MLSWGIPQYLRPVNTLTAEGCSERGPAMDAIKHVLKNDAQVFCFKCSKCYVDLKNARKYQQLFFWF